MADRKEMSHASDGFITALEQALEHYAEPDWIGANSPLAAPYFLGDSVPSMQTDTKDVGAAGRGKALQGLLRAAAQALSDDQRKLLNASFFERNWHANINGVAMKLDMLRAAYYRRRAIALSELARAFSALVSPALRGESVLPMQVIGRTHEQAHALQVLRERGSVTLLGNSGLGKSTMGAAIAGEWGIEHVFWYTVRPRSKIKSLVLYLRWPISCVSKERCTPGGNWLPTKAS